MAERVLIRPLNLFYSYSHKDEAFRDQLNVHLAGLQRDQVINLWHDRQIGAGKEWKGQIDAHLDAAEIILLLISPDFMASDYCHDVEMKRAMERHNNREVRVIPVILRHVDNWRSAPFAKLLAVPKDGKPIKSWTDQDEAFVDVTRQIRLAAEDLTSHPLRARRPY
jgi:TIR domain